MKILLHNFNMEFTGETNLKIFLNRFQGALWEIKICVIRRTQKWKTSLFTVSQSSAVMCRCCFFQGKHLNFIAEVSFSSLTNIRLFCNTATCCSGRNIKASLINDYCQLFWGLLSVFKTYQIHFSFILRHNFYTFGFEV